MAPHLFAPQSRFGLTFGILERLHARDPSASSVSSRQTQVLSDPVQGVPPANTMPAASDSLYLGIGVGVGGALLIAIIVVATQIFRKRAQHQRALQDPYENHDVVQVGRQHAIGEVPRPVSIARCSNFVPLHAKAGWGALSSDETVHNLDPTGRPSKKSRNSVPLPKRLRQQGIPLKRLKHLSAVIESPRSRSAKSPPPVGHQHTLTQSELVDLQKPGFRKTITMIHPVERDVDVFTAPGSPKPDVAPSFAIRSPGQYGAAIANDDRPAPSSSVSVSELYGPVLVNTIVESVALTVRPLMHVRSSSLGAPPTMPPSGAVPPLPRTAPQRTESDESNRQGMHISRASSSSQDSASSSVLVISPILTMRGAERHKTGSPSVEQLVADDDDAQLKSVQNGQWRNPLISGPWPLNNYSHPVPRSKTQASIRSNVARYSAASLADHRLSSVSMASTDSGHNRLSIPQIVIADRMSISRVSSINSLTSITGAGAQKITTPRKPSRQSGVSANGSPTERRKTSTAPTSILREIHTNAVSNITPSRQTSSATQDSGRSSNGNPFQWSEQPLPVLKPSALKGSPTSKGSRGHRRQNCVRISTLTPTFLGPPPSRPTSPSIMCGIEEEGVEGEVARQAGGGLRFVNNQRLSAGSMGQMLKVQTLRASLTPSSPTLSTWTAFQEQYALLSQQSDSQLSVSPWARAISRQSDRSSTFSIPSFPSPSRATVSGIQLDQPVPEFCLSRPSTDGPEEDDGTSPFALHMDSDDGEETPPLPRQQQQQQQELPSSPPLPISKEKEYDPAWPTVIYPQPGPEYDPASPVWCEGVEAHEGSSPAYFPFAVATGTGGPCSDDEQHVSPRSRPTSYGGALPDTPPCSPKTMPEGLRGFMEMAEAELSIRPMRSAEKLTSVNASTIMATIPEVPQNVGFPTTVPILAPPPEGKPQTTPQGRKQRALSSAMAFQPLRPAPPPPINFPDTYVPPPLNVKHATPQGPRSEPAKSVLKNAMALRRMNSEIDCRPHHSRHYSHLGREASPLLPWIGSPDLNESCNDLFDFEFASCDAGAGAEEYETAVSGHEEQDASALDEIDMTDLERRLDGGLGGFDAGPPSTATASRTSSVWEDGEKFWAQRPDFSFTPSSPAPVDVTPTKRGPGCEARGFVTPVGELQMPILNSALGSIGKTPKSLYDSVGFLKT